MGFAHYTVRGCREDCGGYLVYGDKMLHFSHGWFAYVFAASHLSLSQDPICTLPFLSVFSPVPNSQIIVVVVLSSRNTAFIDPSKASFVITSWPSSQAAPATLFYNFPSC